MPIISSPVRCSTSVENISDSDSGSVVVSDAILDSDSGSVVVSDAILDSNVDSKFSMSPLSVCI